MAVQLSAAGTGTVDVRFFGGSGGMEWENGAKFTFVPFDPTKVHLSLAARVFPQKRGQEVDAARQLHIQKQQDELGRLRAYLRAKLPDSRSAPRCISYANLATRLVSETTGRNLILTNGRVCGDAVRINGDPQQLAPTVIVLLRTTSEPGDSQDYARFAARGRTMHRMFPFAKMLQPYQIDDVSTALFGGGHEPEPNSPRVVTTSYRSPAPNAAPGTVTNHSADQLPLGGNGAEMRLVLRTPKPGEVVGQYVRVEGAGGQGEQVIVVVHPVGGGDGYWVQAPADLRMGGTFYEESVIGRGGSVDCNRRYELRAFEQTKEALSTGQQLSSWPEAKAASISVQVIRGCEEK